jgi:hypothetical protein
MCDGAVAQHAHRAFAVAMAVAFLCLLVEYKSLGPASVPTPEHRFGLVLDFHSGLEVLPSMPCHLHHCAQHLKNLRLQCRNAKQISKQLQITTKQI